MPVRRGRGGAPVQPVLQALSQGGEVPSGLRRAHEVALQRIRQGRRRVRRQDDAPGEPDLQGRGEGGVRKGERRRVHLLPKVGRCWSRLGRGHNRRQPQTSGSRGNPQLILILRDAPVAPFSRPPSFLRHGGLHHRYRLTLASPPLRRRPHPPPDTLIRCGATTELFSFRSCPR